MPKEFSIENEYLKVTVTTWGAQVKSVIRKCDNVEHIWQADKSVWGHHAPILFPHAGKVVEGKIEAKGAVYESSQHGFARTMEHDFVEQTNDTIVLELCASEETRAKFPYEFRLVSTFTIENDTRCVYRNIIQYAHSFADVYVGEALAYVNSLDCVAVAINQGSFARAYNVGTGNSWRIRIEPFKGFF